MANVYLITSYTLIKNKGANKYTSVLERGIII